MKTDIIAEIGVNHNGDMTLAERLIDASVKAGATTVKFQTFKAEKLVTKTAPKAAYQKKTTAAEESQFDMLKKLELSWDNHLFLKDICQKKGIEFLSTPFDEDSFELLEKLDVKRYKLSSGDLTNLPLLKRIAATKKPMILSSGMSSLDEIRFVVDFVLRHGTPKDKLHVLHCTTAYPCPFEEVNLKAMMTIAEACQVKPGYSDHTEGIEIAVAAVALGATCIEKHITLDKQLPGPDHKASIEPHEFAAMVSAIRHVELGLGDGTKALRDMEKEVSLVAKKSVVAAGPIPQGTVFTEKNLICKRPGTGISPFRWEELLGKTAKTSYNENDLILASELENY